MQSIRVFKFKIEAGRTRALKARLAALGSRNPDAHPDLPFNQLPMLHFASLTVFDDPTQDYGDELVFESSFDGPFDGYVDALVRQGGRCLEEICGYCQGYPSPDGLVAYLKSHAIAPTLFHMGTPGRTVEHIRNERALRDTIDEDILDDPANANLSARDMRATVQEAVAAPPSTRLNWYPRVQAAGAFVWLPEYTTSTTGLFGSVALLPLKILLIPFAIAGLVLLVVTRVAAKLPFINVDRDQQWTLTLKGHPGSSRLQRLLTWGKYGAVVLLVVLLSPFLAVWERIRRPKKAVREARRHLEVNERRQIRRLRRTEDRRGCIQNHLASIVRLKNGRFTKHILRLKLKFLNAIYRTLFTRGTLAGVPGIHFGHWTLLDEGRTANGDKDPGRVLFLSNYDGTWDNYLDDFVAKLANGVGQIWGGAVGFPGVTDGEIFKNWARLQQTRSSVWYSAYPDLTVETINNHSEIREGLFTPIEKKEALLKSWLLRFGQAGKTLHLEGESVETEGLGKWVPFRNRGPEFNPRDSDIQGILLKSYDPLKYSASIFFRVTDRARTKLWLQDVIRCVTPADVKSTDVKSAVNVAFTFSGLEKLGLSADELATFPAPFTEGMTEQRRRRILGDLVSKDGRPAYWRWGGPRTPIDLVLLVFEDSEEKRDRARRDWTDGFEGRGCGKAVSHVDTYLTAYEHFGFADGISQPIIEGTDAAAALSRAELRWHGVPPGEFVLGYADGSGKIARPPAIGPPSAALGRNGSYLVIRQLDQDVRGFWQYIDKNARARSANGNLETVREEIAARLVGRTPAGDPLISQQAQLDRNARNPVRLTLLHLKYAFRALHQRTTVQWKAFRGIEENKIVKEIRKENSFGFREDPEGFLCPVGAHMRRANPRDLLGDRSTRALAAANRRRILRRGRSYGPFLPREHALEPAPGAVEHDRGLMFMCFNSDIERQFEFIQGQWINNPAFDGLYCESDGFVSPEFSGKQGRATFPRDPLRDRVVDLQSFVTVRGGAYFFLPGIAALRHLANTEEAM